MEGTLAANASIARLLLGIFSRRGWSPAGPAATEQRAEDAKRIQRELLNALEAVQSLDQDRILRRFLNLVTAILRTNYYQQTEDGEPCAPRSRSSSIRSAS